MKSNYLSCSTWLYSHTEKLRFEVKPRIQERYIIQFELETNKIELQLTREDLVEVRDTIEIALIKEEPNAGEAL